MKRVRVQAHFPQLASGHADQQSEGVGGSVPVAISRGVKALWDNPKVRGKRHQTLRLTIIVLE